MSHFSVAVFCHNIDEVAELLEPFSENLTVQPPYGEFVEDEDEDFDEIAQKHGYWCNPNARWDWWEIGGGWRGLLRLRLGKSGYNASNGRCDAALVADCDFSPSESAIHRAVRMWEVLVEGDAPHEGEEFFNPWTPEYYLKRYGDKETFIRRNSAFSTYAFVTAEGEWHEQGRMGWFGMDDATDESITSYEIAFQEYLEKAREQGLMIAIVDCHI